VRTASADLGVDARGQANACSAVPAAPGNSSAMRRPSRLPPQCEPGTAPVGTVDAAAADVTDRLARLQTLDLAEMRQEWRRLYRAEPPRMSRDLMMRALAYRIQEIAFGGLSRATQRRLAALAGEFENNGRIARRPTAAEAGRASGPGMARPYSYSGRCRGWLRVRRKTLSVADQHCAGDHRRALVRTAVLRARQNCCDIRRGHLGRR